MGRFLCAGYLESQYCLCLSDCLTCHTMDIYHKPLTVGRPTTLFI